MGIKIKSAGIFSEPINIGEFFENEEKTGRRNPEDVWIKLREWSMDETRTMGKLKNTEQKSEYVFSNMGSLIIDHNFEEDNGEKASPEAVAGVIKGDSTLTTYIIKRWADANPLRRKINQNAAKQQ